MVVFTCNNCGESVKKTSVEKHFSTRCRNNPKNVSCMDCQKDFHGEEYVAHTKCISEVEKYSGKNYVAKENKNSGEKKQETWMHIVRSILESTEYQMSKQTRNIFQLMQNYDNVPRKKAKFQNFVVNSLKIPINQAQPVWLVLEKELEEMSKAKQQEMAAAKKAIEDAKKAKNAEQNGLKRKQEETNGQVENVGNKKKKKDTKQDAAEQNGKAEAAEETETFNWSTIMEEFVGKNPEGLDVDKLKKKLLKKYKSKLNLEELSEKQQKKFEKKFFKTLNAEQNGLKRKQEETNGLEVENKKKKTDTKQEAVEENGKSETIEETEIFQWSTIVEKIVAKHPEGLDLNELKNKLLKKYKSKLNLEELSEKQRKKFEKKFSKTLKKCPAVKVEDEVTKPC